MPPGQDTSVREAKVARNAENWSRSDRVRELGRGLERRGGLHGEHDELGVADDFLVAAALDAELLRRGPRTLGVAGTDDDLVLAQLGQPLGERTAERARSPDDRDLHASATASSAASASRFRAAVSRMSVRVTIGRTPSALTACASDASSSSMTSASIRPR